MGRQPRKSTDKLRPRIVAICERIAKGETLAQICAERGQLCRETVMTHVMLDPELADIYARARSSQADALFEQILSIAAKATPAEANLARVRIDALKWVASKLAPRKYGDRIEVEQSGGQPNLVVQIGDRVVQPVAPGGGHDG
jgi:hypothetical protein